MNEHEQTIDITQSGNWDVNGVRFATKAAAQDYAERLEKRGESCVLLTAWQADIADGVHARQMEAA